MLWIGGGSSPTAGKRVDLSKPPTEQQKDTDRYPSQTLPSDCCEYNTLGKRKLGTERSKHIQIGSVPPWVSPQDVRARKGTRWNTIHTSRRSALLGMYSTGFSNS
jgi:hypothetical protein